MGFGLGYRERVHMSHIQRTHLTYITQRQWTVHRVRWVNDISKHHSNANNPRQAVNHPYTIHSRHRFTEWPSQTLPARKKHNPVLISHISVLSFERCDIRLTAHDKVLLNQLLAESPIGNIHTNTADMIKNSQNRRTFFSLDALSETLRMWSPVKEPLQTQKCKIEIPTPKSFWEKSQRSEAREPSPLRSRRSPPLRRWLAGGNRTRDVIGGTRCLFEILAFYWRALRVVYNKDVDYRTADKRNHGEDWWL